MAVEHDKGNLQPDAKPIYSEVSPSGFKGSYPRELAHRIAGLGREKRDASKGSAGSERQKPPQFPSLKGGRKEGAQHR